MKSLKSKLSKLAVFAFIGAFSFGLAISCVSNHKQNINKVFAADDISTRWEYNSNNKALSCTYASNYPNGFIMETNQVSVTGLGNGQYEVAYNVLGYPSNSVQPDYTDYGTFTLVFISGSYDSTPSTDGPYGSITAYPLDVSGLDSNTEYEIYIKVEPTGDMNEQGSGEGDDENAGTWTWNEDTQKLSFQFDHTETAGYVSTTSQTMVHGNGNGSFDIGYDLWGTPANATTASNDLLASKTITIYDGYYDEDNSTVTGNPSAISGLQSYGQITIKVDVDTSGTMTSDGWLVNDGDLYFYVLADVNPASIDSITWNNSSGNGTGEAILSVTISTSGGSFQQVYQINNPTFSPELEGTSGTTLGNTTVEGISEWSDRYVTVDISNKSYSLGESTQELESIQITIDGEPVDYIPILLGDSVDLGVILSPSGATASLQWEDPNETGCYTITQTGEYTAHIEAVQLGDASIRVRAIDTQISKTIPLYINQPTQEAEYTVRFDGNGATSGSMSDDIFTTDIVSSYPYILLDCGFERDGYTFAGWGSTDGGSPEWQPTETAYINPGVTIFYAIWESTAPQEAEYTVRFDGNGATSGSMSDDNFTTDIISSYPYILLDCGFERDGYTFVGWGSTDGGSPEWQPTETAYINPGETTFYAIWESIAPQQGTEYIVIFNGNGATSGSMSDDSFSTTLEEYQYSFPYELPECGYSREGYVFTGWGFTETAALKWKPGETRDIQPGETIFYAIWAEIFNITFDANGGTGHMEPISVNSGTRSTVPGCDFVRDGYSFAGWAVNSPDSETIVQPEDTVSVNQDYVLYALWELVGPSYQYTVTFDGNGADDGYVEPIELSGDDSSYTIELPENNYVREGYSFYGWSLSSDGGLPFSPGTERTIDSDTTFYAYWTRSSFTITFNANGGTGEMAARTYEKGNQEVPGCDFVKEGFTFVGWAVDSADSETIVYAGDTVNVAKDYTLYALWEENSPATEEYSYEVVYDANNRSGKTSFDTFTDSNSTFEYEPLSVSDVGFSYEGRTFVGWSLSIDGDVLTGKVTIEAGTTKLYAIWEEESVEPEPTPEYKQYWTYDDLELRYVDEAHPDYLTRVDKAIYSERSSTASVLVSILNEQEEVVDTKYISLSDASYAILEEGYGSVTGYFNLLTNEDKVITLEYLEIAVEKIPVTPEEKAADVSEEQIAQINSLLPETQDSRVEEVIGDLNQGTAYQIVEVATDTKTFIDKLREEGGEDYTEEDYQRDLQTVQSATEAAVVVGAASKDSNIAAQVQEMTKSAPQDTGVNLGGVLKDFYEQQMQYLLGEAVAKKDGEQTTRRITRAEAPKVNKVDVTDFLKQEFDQMLDFVDRSVDDIEDTLLQVRKCSHESVKLAVNQSITTITSKSFRDFDKDKADREFVETLEPVMMATMQSQVLAVLEEEYNNSDHRNKDKDQVILDEIDAVKDIEMFRIMVMEVLRQKYESLDGSKSYEDDLEKFTEEIYWPCFEAWALDKESPVGFTFEELTKATIESSSKRAKSYVIATSADKPEIVFISVFAGVTAVAIAGAIAVPTVLKKKRRGLAE